MTSQYFSVDGGQAHRQVPAVPVQDPDGEESPQELPAMESPAKACWREAVDTGHGSGRLPGRDVGVGRGRGGEEGDVEKRLQFFPTSSFMAQQKRFRECFFLLFYLLFPCRALQSWYRPWQEGREPQRATCEQWTEPESTCM